MATLPSAPIWSTSSCVVGMIAALATMGEAPLPWGSSGPVHKGWLFFATTVSCLTLLGNIAIPEFSMYCLSSNSASFWSIIFLLCNLFFFFQFNSLFYSMSSLQSFSPIVLGATRAILGRVWHLPWFSVPFHPWHQVHPGCIIVTLSHRSSVFE